MLSWFLFSGFRPLLRGLVRQPGFSALAILTLALGIGVNVAIFSALEAVVLNPLPYPAASRLVAIYEDATWLGYPKNTPAPANFMDWKKQVRSFEDMAATNSCRAVFTGDAAPEEVGCRNVTANLWPMLGVRPLIGRWFTSEEDHPQPSSAVIGEGLWVRRFGRDPKVVGRQAVINGQNMTITGVMPGWFHFGGDRDTDLWMPSGFSPQQLAQRGSHFLTCYGRLKPGVTVRQADAELKTIQAGINRLDPNNSDPRQSASVESLRDSLAGNMGPALWILMAAAGTVLLIACANVASLLLARATRRKHEIAVRTSLGANSWQLANGVLAETALLAAAGAALGIGLAFLSRRLLENFIPPALKGTVAIDLDPRILLFAIAVSLGAALFASLTPIWQTVRNPLAGVLRQDSRSGPSRSSVRMRSALVVGEIALTVTLLAGAGLMVRSFLVIWNTGLGFDPNHLMVVRVSIPVTRYQTAELRSRFYHAAVEKVLALPGVAAADFASSPPFYSTGNSMGYAIEGRTPEGKWENGDMLTRVSTPGYLETLGAHLAAGRYFNANDRAGTPDVAIVNETFAHTFFPHSSPIGTRMSVSDATGTTRRWREIIGVVREVRERGYDPAPKPVTYLTSDQTPSFFPNQLVVRAKNGSGRELVNSIRRAIAEVDPNQPIGVVRTFEEVLALDQASRRQELFLLLLFAALSLTMACFGIYAILAYSVELRRQEIGVRIALGANRSDVFRIVTSDGLKLTAAGALLGLLAAAAGGRLIRSSLYGVEPLDPATLGTVCVVLGIVAFLACWVPSWRAAGTNPSIAMRDQ